MMSDTGVQVGGEKGSRSTWVWHWFALEKDWVDCWNITPERPHEFFDHTGKTWERADGGGWRKREPNTPLALPPYSAFLLDSAMAEVDNPKVFVNWIDLATNQELLRRKYENAKAVSFPRACLEEIAESVMILHHFVVRIFLSRKITGILGNWSLVMNWNSVSSKYRITFKIRRDKPWVKKNVL